MEFKHVPVLASECIEALNIKEDGIYVDGTLGGAGHSSLIAKKLSSKGKLIGIDRDKEALKAASNVMKDYDFFIPVHNNHSNILEVLKDLNISGVDGILLDLGVSSYQLDEASRGFSYMHSAPLDMRMNKEDKLTAFDIVNKYPESKLLDILYTYGEENYSKNIVKNILEARKIKTIDTTLELVDIIKKSIPGKAMKDKGHPAKRTFQAIRIEVNSELENLKQTVKDCITALNDKGRLAVISFHSLEDRIVKKAYEEMEGRCTCPKGFPICNCGYISYGEILTKKPTVPTDKEIEENARSKSSKLRVFEKKNK